jgi:uncharacterized protein
MKQLQAYRPLLFLCLLALMVNGCKDPDAAPDEDLTFAPALENYKLVVQGRYQAALNSTIDLSATVSDFQTNVNQDNLLLMQQALKTAWLDWELASPYKFGVAETLDSHSKINTFPADTSAIASRVENGTWEGLNFDEMGFPSLDYLINGGALEDFTTNDFAINRLNFLEELASLLTADLTSLNVSWQSNEGNFVSQTGASATSSMSQLVNGLIADYEQLKRDKIALPLGLLTLDIPLPEHVECLFGEFSAELARKHLRGILDAYCGISVDGVNGVGLDDLLNDVDAFHEASQSPLDQHIQNQIQEALLALDNVPDPLNVTIEESPELVEAAYVELQDIVILLKSDMPSVLGISITFTDNDGD